MKRFNGAISSFVLLMFLCLCGTQGYAQTFTFNNAGSVAIPDNAYNGTLASMANLPLSVSGVPNNGTAVVTISVRIGHTWAGDLTAKLVAPDGKVLALMSRPGYIESADDGNGCCGSLSDFLIANTITFDDAASTPSENIGASNPIPTGSWQPSAGAISVPPAYATFSALVTDLGVNNINGTWTLYIGDSGGGDTGTFSNFGMTIEFTPGGGGGTTDVCELICPADQYVTLQAGECSYYFTYPLSITPQCVVTPAPVLNFTGAFAPGNGQYPVAAGIFIGSFTGNTTLTIPSTDLGSNAGTTYYQPWIWKNLPTTGTVKFNWSWTTTDGPFWDNSGYLKDVPTTMTWFGNQTGTAYGCYQLTNNGGANAQSGTNVSVSVNQGGNFGFYSYTADGIGGACVLTITNFSFQAAPQLPTVTQTAGVNVGYVADFGNGYVDVITEEFPIGTTTVTYSGNGPDGPIECSFNVVVNGYPNPITSLGCNDLVHVSLDPENCEAVITAETMLEGGPYGCYEDYEVAIGASMAGPFNLGNTVNCSNIGQTLAVRV
ncbi:MAG: proprotein convertase P-domain-containing protein, partial [Saprospiraceae bacterium]|nr:proprotein convertase P-domain-containing protein [Saprospiraceae bacterium]